MFVENARTGEQRQMRMGNNLRGHRIAGVTLRRQDVKELYELVSTTPQLAARYLHTMVLAFAAPKGDSNDT